MKKLKYLLEDINTDKDKIIRKKGYITYAKFAYYADKMLDGMVESKMLPKISKVDEIYKKRELLLKNNRGSNFGHRAKEQTYRRSSK